MQEFHHVVWDGDENSEKKTSNCHDTYVNLVNDKLAAIKFLTPEDFKLIPEELDSLASGLRNLAKNLSKVNSNTETLQQFIKNATYKAPAINDLANLIDPDMGYVYPEHLKDFIEKILQQRIAAYKTSIAEKLSTAQSQAKQLNSTTNEQQPKPAVVFAKTTKRLLKKRICEKYGIEECTMKPEFDLILKIVRALNYIEKGHPSEELIDEIYNTVGLYKNALIPNNPEDDLDQFYKKHDKIILTNLKALLDGSFFTIDKFLALDIDSRWNITIYPIDFVFGDTARPGIDVLTAKTDALQIYITCRKLLMDVQLGKKPLVACMVVFEMLGTDLLIDKTDESLDEQLTTQLQTVCDTIVYIMVPFEIELSLYSSFNPASLIVAQNNIVIFKLFVNSLQACPIKLLQLNPVTLTKLLFDIDITNRCNLSGISISDLLGLPTKEIEMIFSNEQYIHRLPVLTLAYFLSPQQFLDASSEQKQIWLERPAATKLWFDSQNLVLGPHEFKEALAVIDVHTRPILDKLVATEALLYIKELLLTPWHIVTLLQKQGLKYSQCRAIFKLIKSINECFTSIFITRFTEQNEKLFDEEYLINYTSIQLRFGQENGLTLTKELQNYIESLRNVLEATSHDQLPREFIDIIRCNDQNELITNLSKNLCLSNTFCKHLRLYKQTKHEALLGLFDISVPQVRSRYYAGDAKIFEQLCAGSFDYDAINKELNNNPYYIRNSQEFGMFVYAIESDDLTLINLISDSIKVRSEKDIQQFLKANRFPYPPAPKLSLLFNHTIKLNTRLINMVHPDTGDTPLLAAIRQQDVNIALALIIWGADLEVKDLEGLTPGILATKLDIAPTVHDISYKLLHNKMLADNAAQVNSAVSRVRL
jgi:hypothetical protein